MDNETGQDKYASIYRKTIEDSVLFLCHWELTYGCNLKCRHCYICRDASRQEFTLEKAKAVMDELKELGCLYLVLSGGELFTRADFFEIARYARKKDFALRLMSNATLIKEEDYEKIASLYPLTFETSLYAADAQIHDTVTGVNGSFEKTLRAAQALKKLNVRVVFKFLIMKDTLDGYPKAKALAENLGIELLFDFSVAQRDDGSTGPLQYRIEQAGLKRFFVENDIRLKRTEDPTPFICSAGLNNVLITPYLDVYPCVGLKIALGNLYRQPLKEIWETSEMLATLRKTKDEDLRECQRCRLKYYCYRCPGLAYHENKDLWGPSRYDCSIAETVEELITERSKEYEGCRP